MLRNTQYTMEIPGGNGVIAVFDSLDPNGPLALKDRNGRVFFKNLHNAFDGRGMQVIKAGCYRKANVGVNENESRFNATDATGIFQITRISGAVARVTTDVMLKRGTALKQSLQIGSFRLPDVWTCVRVLERNGEWTRHALQSGLQLSFPAPLPLAWVFEREDGFLFETLTGFDLWRWDYGLALPGVCCTIDVATDGAVDFTRAVLTVPPQSDDAPGIEPPQRDYRFCYQLAWAEQTRQDGADERPADAVLELATLPGMRTEQGVVCWEDNASLQYAKKAIRQLKGRADSMGAANAPRILELTGLLPHVCMNGKHVAHPRGEHPHWDLNGMICFVQWARQCLGESWRLRVKTPAEWSGLPSMLQLSSMD